MEEFENALQDFHKAAELNEKNPIHHLLIAKVLIQQGKSEEAKPIFDKAEILAKSTIKDWHHLQSYPEFYEI